MLGILDFIGSEQSGLPSIFLTAKPHVKMKSLHRMNVTRHFCSPDFDFFFLENSPLAPTTHVYHEFKQDEIGQHIKLHVQCTDSCQ